MIKLLDSRRKPQLYSLRNENSNISVVLPNTLTMGPQQLLEIRLTWVYIYQVFCSASSKNYKMLKLVNGRRVISVIMERLHLQVSKQERNFIRN